MQTMKPGTKKRLVPLPGQEAEFQAALAAVRAAEHRAQLAQRLVKKTQDEKEAAARRLLACSAAVAV